jgi:hypothetical protein
LPDSDLEQCLVSDEKAGKRTGAMGLENQELFTAKDAEESQQNQHQNQRPFTTEDTENTEEGKTLPPIHGKPGQVNTDEQERVKQRVEELVGKLGETYDELIRLMDQNPAVVGQVTGTTANHETANHEKVDRKLKSRLELADAMPRCRWIKQGGTTCGSPQMKNHIYCFAHTQMAEAQALALRLPPPEDANAIQVGLMRIQKALIEDTITTRKAGLLLYSMQLALTNVGQTTFGQAKDEELVRETVDEEEAISSQRAAISERQNQRPFTAKDAEDAKENGERQKKNIFTTEDAENAEGSSERQNQHQQQRPFTAKDAQPPQQAKTGLAGGPGYAKEEEGLVRMPADIRGVQQRTKQIEWRPTPDMYRMDTREGREAYEATLRPKIARPCAEGRPPQAGIALDESAGTHYSSLRDERLPKGPRSASEPLDADTGAGSVPRTEPYAVLG